MDRGEMMKIRHKLQMAIGDAGGDITGAGTDLITDEMDISFELDDTRYKVILKELT